NHKCARPQSAFSDRAKVVQLHFDGGDPLLASRQSCDRHARGRIRHRCGDSAVQNARAIEKFPAYRALDGEPIFVRTDRTNAEKGVERHFLRPFLHLLDGQGLSHRRCASLEARATSTCDKTSRPAAKNTMSDITARR